MAATKFNHLGAWRRLDGGNGNRLSGPISHSLTRLTLLRRSATQAPDGGHRKDKHHCEKDPIRPFPLSGNQVAQCVRIISRHM